jgi:hypothetical protein
MSQASIHRDLANWFGERLHKHILDAFSLGEDADIPVRDTHDAIMAFLLAELACGAWACNMNEERFLKICLGSYRQTKKQFDALDKKRKAQRQH